MEAVVLLADWAEAINGKLYIQGGGWSRVHAPNGNVNLALAIKLLVGWSEANRKHQVAIRLVNEDGEQVEPEPGKPLLVQTELEVGRPAGLREGTDLDVPLAVTFIGVPFVPGRYRFVLEVDGTPLGTGATFDVF